MSLSGMLVWILLVLSVLPGHGIILIRGMAEVYLSGNGLLRAVIILIYMSLWLMVHWLVCQNNTARSCLHILVQKLCVVQLVNSCALLPSSSNDVYQLSNWLVNFAELTVLLFLLYLFFPSVTLFTKLAPRLLTLSRVILRMSQKTCGMCKSEWGMVQRLNGVVRKCEWTKTFAEPWRVFYLDSLIW